MKELLDKEIRTKQGTQESMFSLRGDSNTTILEWQLRKIIQCKLYTQIF